MLNPVEKILLTPKGIYLYTESFGPETGKPLLLIMGAMNQGIFWYDAFCRLLAEAGFRVIRYDNRDTGRSSVIDYKKSPYTLDDMTEDAGAILDAYGAKGAVVMGMSMGGYIAHLLAVNYPDYVERLLLLSTTADQRPYMYATEGAWTPGLFELPPPREVFLQYVAKAVYKMPLTTKGRFELAMEGWRVIHAGSLPFPEQEIGALLELATQRTQKRLAAFNHAFAVGNSPPRLDILDRVKVPTLVLHGEFDPCLPLEHGQYLASHIPGARLMTLDMGHLLPPALSTMVAREIIAFSGL